MKIYLAGNVTPAIKEEYYEAKRLRRLLAFSLMKLGQRTSFITSMKMFWRFKKVEN